MLERMVRIGRLFDLYGPLLTSRQQDFIRLYHYHDLSLGEIAEKYGITRQAVYDTLNRSENSLEEYERRLGFHSRLLRTQVSLDDLIAVSRRIPGDPEGDGELMRWKRRLLDGLERLSRELSGQNGSGVR